LSYSWSVNSKGADIRTLADIAREMFERVEDASKDGRESKQDDRAD
jgi:hypothetical protein